MNAFEEIFKNNAVGLSQTIVVAIQQLYDAGYKTVSPVMASAVPLALGIMESTKIIEGFIKGSYIDGPEGEKTINCWDRMKERDEDFFLDNVGTIFADLPVENVKLFVALFKTKDEKGRSVVSREIKNNVWDILDAMITLAIQYLHRERKPFSVVEDGVVKKKYAFANLFSFVKLGPNCKTWNVAVSFPPKMNA